MSNMLSNWSRPYYQAYDQKPFLFYVVFGDFVLDAEIERATVVLPGGLDLRVVESGFFTEGASWELCRTHSPEVAETVRACSQALVLQGEISSEESLDYLKATLDFLTFLTDLGGRVVHDPLTLAWYSSEEWLAREELGQIFNPFDHTVILSSVEADGVWLHTRGLLKFGRPDLSVRGLSEEEVPVLKKVMDRFISFQALGGVIEPHREIVLEGVDTGFGPSDVRGSLDDPDFNNTHVELQRKGSRPAIG